MPRQDYPFEERNELLDTILKDKDKYKNKDDVKQALVAFIDEETTLLANNVDIPQKKSHALGFARGAWNHLEGRYYAHGITAAPLPPPFFAGIFQDAAAAQAKPAQNNTGRTLDFNQ